MKDFTELEKWLIAQIKKYTDLEEEEFFDERLINNYLGKISILKDLLKEITQNQ